MTVTSMVETADDSPRDVEPDIGAAAAHAKEMLSALGIDCDNEHMARTPERMVHALAEITEGRYVDPGRHLAVTFPAESGDPGMIVVPGVKFVSLCAHHMLPFVGVAAVAYLPAPGARIVGLSKLARVVKELAAQPQVQERLGEQIVGLLVAHLDTVGAACLLRSAHTCMTLRGPRADGADMITSHLAGRFRTDPVLRAELMSLASVSPHHARL